MGNEITFTTAEAEPEPEKRLAVLTTSAATEITDKRALLWGSVTNVGYPAYTERGFYLAAGHTPTESDLKVSASGTGTGTFSVTAGLTPGTTYCVRAYARSTAGIAWGNEITFTMKETEKRPEVSTGSITGVTDMRATLIGSITDVGNPAYTERGFCWDTHYYANPTVDNNRIPVPGSGSGSFSVELTGLQGGKAYNVRAYAINALGTVYGSTRSFTTYSRPAAPANLIAVAVSSSQIDLHWAAVPDAIGYKVEYSTNRISGWTQVSGAINGTTCRVEGFTANTRYYFRICAYTLSGDSSWSQTANALTTK